jgi:hypothetical protein
MALPVDNRRLVALQGATAGALATPAETAQDAPDVSCVITHPALRRDQVTHPAGGPQPGAVAQCFGTALECLLDLLKLGGSKLGFATGTAGFLQTRSPRLRQLARSANHRLPVHTQASGHFALAYPLLKQLRRFHPAPL